MFDTYEYRCSLVRVTDGDTVVLAIDVGFRLTATMPVRLYGLACPELRTATGKAARAWVIDWFGQHQNLTVTTYRDPEKYGRWLGVVHPQPEGPSLNDALIAAEIAKPWDGRGPQPT